MFKTLTGFGTLSELDAQAIFSCQAIERRETLEKVNFKKKWNELYNPSEREVAAVDFPKMSFLMIDGAGNPNTSQQYKEAVEALFSLSCAIKCTTKYT